MDLIIRILAQELGQCETHVRHVVDLLDAGNTIPFIARYRKEQHGAMDDTTLRTLADRLVYLRNLADRRAAVKSAIAAQERLTDELARAIDRAATLAEVEDLYRPYRPKRRTRATAAREKGLEPLAQRLLAQTDTQPAETLAASFVDPKRGVADVAAALQGASDLIAETLCDDAAIRKTLRGQMQRQAQLVCKAVDTENDSVYRLYYAYAQPVAKAADHQILAINRGERAGYLRVSIAFDRALGVQTVRRAAVRPGSAYMALIRAAADDAYDRLLAPSLEREFRAMLTQRAEEGAVANFARNLRQLLMQPPVRGCVTMGLDPGYRNGCKVAVVDATGKVLDTAVVYPTFSKKKRDEAIRLLSQLIRQHGVKHIAIGNGTASRETEAMTAELIAQLGGGVSYMMVNEAGASVYSASPLAAEEFPQFDVNLRSAVSIARRLQDPLAELVKIDPKAIGVGQYQHDVPEKRLDESLRGVVEDCVNAVGVDINTASASLLRYVSGLTAATARQIVAYREANGPFQTRQALLQVPKLGAKTFQQCAGFLRLPDSAQILDRTGVHPESYAAAERLLQRCGFRMEDVACGALAELPDRVRQAGEETMAAACGVGVPTLRDMVKDLCKPGRDPRDALPAPLLRTDVLELKDLKPGMVLWGTVRNVIDFGAFVDVGVHQDGLLHISQIGARYLRHPSEVLAVGDVIRVAVLEVDVSRKRISLTRKQLPDSGV